MTVEEGWHTTGDGKKLYTKTFKVLNVFISLGITNIHIRRKGRLKHDWYSSTDSQM